MNSERKILYQCLKCGFVFEEEKVSKRISDTRCPSCGYYVIKKIRGRTAKIIMTSKLEEEEKII